MLSSAHHDGRYAPLSPEEYATAIQSAYRTELYPTLPLSSHSRSHSSSSCSTPHPATVATRTSGARGPSTNSQPYCAYTDLRSSSGRIAATVTTHTALTSPASSPQPQPTHAPLASPNTALTRLDSSASRHSPHIDSAPLSLPPPAATAAVFSCTAAHCFTSVSLAYDGRTASIFKVANTDSERLTLHSARRGSGSRSQSAMSAGQQLSADSQYVSTSPSLRASLLCRRSSLSPLCLSPLPRRLFASPIRKFSSLSVREANILLAAKQEKAAKLREECLARQQEKLKVAAMRVEAAEQRLMARMQQMHDAVSGRLTAAQHIHELGVEEKRKKATTENQKVAEVVFINQLTEQMGTDRKAALDKKLSRTEQRRKQRQAERLHVVTQQAAKHKLILERRAQQVDDKDAVIARIQNKLDEARKRRQQRRHAAAAAAAAAQHDNSQVVRFDDERVSAELSASVDAASYLSLPSSDDVVDDESFSAIDFNSHYTQHWLQAQHMDSADELLTLDDAVCTPTHPHGRAVRRRQARPASSPAPIKHQKGSTAADSRFGKQTDGWAADVQQHYTQPPSPTGDDTRVITIYQLRHMDAKHADTSSTDDDDRPHTGSTTTVASSLTSHSSSKRRKRAAHCNQQQSVTADCRSSSLACVQCPVCKVLLPDDAYLALHVGSSAHQQRTMAMYGRNEGVMWPAAVWLSWADIGRSFVQASSKSSRRNAKKRANKLKQHAHAYAHSQSQRAQQALKLEARSAEQHLSDCDSCGELAPRPNGSARLVDACVLAKPVASLIQQLDEAVAGRGGALQCSDDWLSALLLRLQTADGSIRRDISLSTATESMAEAVYEEKEGLIAPVSVSSSDVHCCCVLVEVLLSRCLCAPYPTDILAAACQLIDTTLTSPPAQQPLVTTLMQHQRLVPAVCSFNSWLCTLLAHAAQSRRAVQCDEYAVGMFTLLSSSLRISARTQPSAGASLLRVMAVCGLLRRGGQMLVCLLSQIDMQRGGGGGTQQPEGSPLAIAAAAGGAPRPPSAAFSSSACLSSCCRPCLLLRTALSIVRLAHAALSVCAECAAHVALSAEVVASFQSTALLAVVPLMATASMAWADECAASHLTVHSLSSSATSVAPCVAPSIEPLLDACLDVCLVCSETDSPVSLSSCTPCPLPLLHSALSRMSLVLANRSTCAMALKLQRLTDAITCNSQLRTTHDELDWDSVHLSLRTQLTPVHKQ